MGIRQIPPATGHPRRSMPDGRRRRPPAQPGPLQHAADPDAPGTTASPASAPAGRAPGRPPPSGSAPRCWSARVLARGPHLRRNRRGARPGLPARSTWARRRSARPRSRHTPALAEAACRPGHAALPALALAPPGPRLSSRRPVARPRPRPTRPPPRTERPADPGAAPIGQTASRGRGGPGPCLPTDPSTPLSRCTTWPRSTRRPSRRPTRRQPTTPAARSPVPRPDRCHPRPDHGPADPGA